MAERMMQVKRHSHAHTLIRQLSTLLTYVLFIQDAEKGCVFLELPPVLQLQLKRHVHFAIAVFVDAYVCAVCMYI